MMLLRRLTASLMKCVERRHVLVDEGEASAAHLGRQVAVREDLPNVLADQPELLAEALEVHERRAEVVGDAVDEGLDLRVLVAQLEVAVLELPVEPVELPLGALALHGSRPSCR